MVSNIRSHVGGLNQIKFFDRISRNHNGFTANTASVASNGFTILKVIITAI